MDNKAMLEWLDKKIAHNQMMADFIVNSSFKGFYREEISHYETLKEMVKEHEMA